MLAEMGRTRSDEMHVLVSLLRGRWIRGAEVRVRIWRIDFKRDGVLRSLFSFVMIREWGGCKACISVICTSLRTIRTISPRKCKMEDQTFGHRSTYVKPTSPTLIHTVFLHGRLVEVVNA